MQLKCNFAQDVPGGDPSAVCGHPAGPGEAGHCPRGRRRLRPTAAGRRAARQPQQHEEGHGFHRPKTYCPTASLSSCHWLRVHNDLCRCRCCPAHHPPRILFVQVTPIP